jgi:hypothetical protein
MSLIYSLYVINKSGGLIYSKVGAACAKHINYHHSYQGTTRLQQLLLWVLRVAVLSGAGGWGVNQQ